jgi:hypothetical protein
MINGTFFVIVHIFEDELDVLQPFSTSLNLVVCVCEFTGKSRLDKKGEYLELRAKASHQINPSSVPVPNNTQGLGCGSVLFLSGI